MGKLESRSGGCHEGESPSCKDELMMFVDGGANLTLSVHWKS